jgi:putative pyruvate formate lyase activating enzyme
MEILKKLDGVIDIYLPDFKYADRMMADKFSSGAVTYPEITKSALLEMHRQVGDLRINERGVATRGLLVRHLVLPQGLAGTAGVCRFLSEEISQDTYLNVMSQYRPCFKAHEIPELGRSISREEFTEAVEIARSCGMNRLDRIEHRFPAWTL